MRIDVLEQLAKIEENEQAAKVLRRSIEHYRKEAEGFRRKAEEEKKFFGPREDGVSRVMFENYKRDQRRYEDLAFYSQSVADELVSEALDMERRINVHATYCARQAKKKRAAKKTTMTITITTTITVTAN